MLSYLLTYKWLFCNYKQYFVNDCIFICEFIILNSTCLSKINLNIYNMKYNIKISTWHVQNNYKSIITKKITQHNYIIYIYPSLSTFMMMSWWADFINIMTSQCLNRLIFQNSIIKTWCLSKHLKCSTASVEPTRCIIINKSIIFELINISNDFSIITQQIANLIVGKYSY